MLGTLDPTNEELAELDKNPASVPFSTMTRLQRLLYFMMQDGSSPLLCPLCVMPVEEGTPLITPSPCGHKVCSRCYSEWLTKTGKPPGSCMVCRVP